MAKNTGKVFEEAIKKSAERVFGLYQYRLRDPASSFNQSANTGLRFSITNDYDTLFYKYPYFYPLELKSTTTTSFSFQRDKKEESKQIKKHQIDGLEKAGKVQGIYAGFLFNFSKKSKTYWLDIHDFKKFQGDTEKKSINESDIIEYGGIIVDQVLLQTNYRYSIQKMLEDIIEYKTK